MKNPNVDQIRWINRSMELRRRLKRKLKTLMGNQTQEVFARKINISQASLNRVLKTNQDVGIDMIEQICKYTGSTVEDLLGGPEVLETHTSNTDPISEVDAGLPRLNEFSNP